MCGPIEQPLRTTCPTKNPAFAGFFESGRPDLNRGPHRPERCALPGCATPRRGASIPHRYLRLVAASTTDILEELAPVLQPARFQDYGPNGLQVPGSHQVATLAPGVSPTP